MKQPLFSTKILLLFLFLCFQTYAQRPFIGTWYTATQESKDKNTLHYIKIFLEGQYTYTWENVEKPEINGEGSGIDDFHLFFSERGKYRISFTPTGKTPLHRIYHKQREVPIRNIDGNFLELEQWGDVKWSTMKDAFRERFGLVVTATDNPDLSKVTDMSYMLSGIHDINHSIDDW